MLFASSAALLVAAAAVLSVGRDYQRQDKLSTRSVVLVWVAYLGHAGVVIWASLDRAWPIPIPLSIAVALGLVLAGAGLTLLSLAIWQFRSIQRMSGVETDRLISGGIYGWSRNPQNLGWGVALLGIAFLGRSGLALSLIGAFALLIHLYIVQLEEPCLEALYGDEFRAYRARTERYMSHPWGSNH